MLKETPFRSEACEISSTHGRKSLQEVVIPAGLEELKYLWGVRIFSIAGTLDAVTCDRPYRKAQSLDALREETKAVAEPSWISRSMSCFSACRTTEGRTRAGDQRPDLPLHVFGRRTIALRL